MTDPGDKTAILFFCLADLSEKGMLSMATWLHVGIIWAGLKQRGYGIISILKCPFQFSEF